jgi:3D (Asp-Asp-Asp) domain-containing protein
VSVWAGVAAVVLLIGLELLAVVAVVDDTDAPPITLMALNVSRAEQASMVIDQPVALTPVTLEIEPQLETEPVAAPISDDIHYFGDRPIRRARTIRMLVTAYSPDERSCGKFADNITASGYSVWTNGMKLVAADTDLLPFGTVVTIPGYNGGRPVPVLDRGGKIKGARIDVLYPTHEIARRWGVQWLDVDVWEYAD